MLKHLEYAVTFPSNNRTLAESIDFQKGYGTITGPNGAGKSSVIEFIRFSLFGTAALRGKADDYKTLKTRLVFSVKGVEYTVERNKSGAKLYKGDTLIVSGTTPVNQKIVSIFGFGLTVFDVACVANQGDIEKLGSMRPTERKQMVDSVIGLGVIEDLAKWAGDEALTLKRQATTLLASTSKPTEPVIPVNYQPLAELDQKISQMRDTLFKIQTLKGTPLPGPRPTDLPLDEVKDRAKVMSLVNELKSIPPASMFETDYLDAQEALHNLEPWKGIPEPKYSETDLNQWLTDLALLDHKAEGERLQKQIERLEAGATECPSCGHEWTEDDARLQQLRNQLAQIPDWVGVKSPPLSEKQILTMLEDWVTYHAQDPYYEIEVPVLSRQRIAEERHKHSFNDRRNQLLEATQDYDGTDYTKLTFQLETWQMLSEAYDNAQAVITELEPKIRDLPDLERLRDEVRAYDLLLARYRVDVEHFDDVMSRVGSLTSEAESWSGAKTALSSLRGKIKQYLVPSLNKVASYFLSQMTNGQKQVIQVDEDFEVLVDNQTLNTLSGSEKAVANLALRLGLGQVLTNNIFPVFIGDEIDASMDSTRAKSTSDILWMLSQSLSQILIVSHKSLEADYCITIGTGTSDGLHTSNS